MLRGNAGEVATLVGVEAEVRGVESIGGGGDPAELAREAARALGVVASVTGPVDHVSDGERVVAIANGHPLMASITGTGCMSSAITGCFLAVADSPLDGAAEALVAFGVAGEDAARDAKGPGSFHVALYDALAALDPATLDDAGEGLREGSRASSATSRRRGARSRRARPSSSSASRRRPPRSSRAAAGFGELGVTFVVNDDVDAALALGADGVHLGQSDRGRGAGARGRPAPRPLGVHVRAGARGADADYLGVGPVWETPSKERRRPAARARRAGARSARRSRCPSSRSAASTRRTPPRASAPARPASR